MATRSEKKEKRQAKQLADTESLVPREWLDHVQDLLFSQDQDPEAIAACLDRLSEAMQRRFAREEASGRYEEAIYQEPSLTALAESLRREHGELLAELQELRQEFVAAHGSPRNWRKFCDRFGEFCEDYLEHETNEQTLTPDGMAGNDRGFRQ